MAYDYRVILLAVDPVGITLEIELVDPGPGRGLPRRPYFTFLSVPAGRFAYTPLAWALPEPGLEEGLTGWVRRPVGSVGGPDLVFFDKRSSEPVVALALGDSLLLWTQRDA